MYKWEWEWEILLMYRRGWEPVVFRFQHDRYVRIPRLCRAMCDTN